MKLRQDTPNEPLTAGLVTALTATRTARGFDPAAYLDAKVALLGEYFDRSGLHTAAVALSGGIDSAVVAGICAAALDSDAISGLALVTAPVHTPGAVTHQSDTVARARDVANRLGHQLHVIDLTDTHQTLLDETTATLGVGADPWAAGQLASLVRTPAMYMVNTLLTSTDRPAVLCGTINRDEGAWLGYLGKSGDGMVDIQMISDLHKSEVYTLARHLDVPDSVIAVEPNGDMFDGRPDTDVFGAPYDFVELYLSWLCLRPTDQARLIDQLDPAAANQWERWSASLERLHRLNAHKYLVGSPAVHLDVLRSDVPGGWEPPRHRALDAAPPTTTAGMHGWFDPGTWVSDLFADTAAGTPPGVETLELVPVRVGTDVLEPTETATLRDLVTRTAGSWQPSGPNGARVTDPSDAVSWRRTAWLPELGRLLVARLTGSVPAFVHGDDPTFRFDTGGDGIWQWVGVNPLMRFIRYDVGGWLVVHTDSPWVASDRTRSLMSLVVYLDGNGGTTRFLAPGLEGAGVDRFGDWNRGARPDEVAASVTPSDGGAVWFPHRLLHDGAPATDNKLILRTDLMFERCGPPRPR